MKKLLRTFSICITASMLFSSCGSNLSIMKRHYTSGYYVDYTSNNKAITPKSEDRIAQSVAENQASAMQYPDKPNNVQAKAVPAGNEKKLLSRGNAHIIARPIPASKLSVEESPFWASSKAVYESPKAVSSISDDERGEKAALSLLWLVIVIVLILWLIGILAGGFGLGGLINLLLVVALILLILWLLRII